MDDFGKIVFQVPNIDAYFSVLSVHGKELLLDLTTALRKTISLPLEAGPVTEMVRSRDIIGVASRQAFVIDRRIAAKQSFVYPVAKFCKATSVRPFGTRSRYVSYLQGS